jgi:hypothetical protein
MTERENGESYMMTFDFPSSRSIFRMIADCSEEVLPEDRPGFRLPSTHADPQVTGERS